MFLTLGETYILTNYRPLGFKEKRSLDAEGVYNI